MCGHKSVHYVFGVSFAAPPQTRRAAFFMCGNTREIIMRWDSFDGYKAGKDNRL
ncbi:MAG: hypothetical protein Pg6C_03950 [Treponemataceae bacterium]|nr:MAG: hypothetical protein Pg6C_03950 [Treponemataceae bacterium]